ncbi:MAG: zinc ribbon domain-containing protein [Gemmatimonadetes bacterium]|nr:zinc ribbon domain-containing protein [Gemmatimonadota bacterium]
MTALLVGSGLAVAALLYVLLPLLRGVDAAEMVDVVEPSGAEPVAGGIEALREIEFDRATGKLSDEDYAALRARYAPLALAELRAREGAASAPVAGTPSVTLDGNDPVEAMIARARARASSCATCGPRPESDALFCSDCGCTLLASCLRCGAAVEAPQARFCTGCGAALAA